MIELYWDIGRTILDRQQNEPWGSKVLERLARDLRAEFPHMKGFFPHQRLQHARLRRSLGRP
ncbi:DUF1016 N-terminal domain-containing protein [Arthrobacter sp. Leaf137]|uniref:DUF1016 N-terminal domain-containing protein n=1 Tax=Arthrobacter sp. Leaf137 TaxID=1736271 RepID=UPI003369E9BE